MESSGQATRVILVRWSAINHKVFDGLVLHQILRLNRQTQGMSQISVKVVSFNRLENQVVQVLRYDTRKND
jgi:hypothetical protein